MIEVAEHSSEWVDEKELSVAICEILGLVASDLGKPGMFERLFDTELKVKDGFRTGAIVRYKKKDPKTGEVVGHVFKREDLAKYIAAHRKTAAPKGWQVQ